MNHARTGSTLIELVLYMGIFSMLLGMLLTVFSSILSVQLESEASSSVTMDGTYILNRLSYDVGRAQSIVLPASPGQSGNTMEVFIDGQSYTYQESNGTLTLVAGSAIDTLTGVGTNLSLLSFTRLGNPNGKHSVRVSYTLTSSTRTFQGPRVQSFQTTMTLR